MDIASDVRKVRFLPAYFSAISHLLSLLSQEEPSIPLIVEAVGSDQSLTSRLLNIVNSPVYGSVRQIGSIEDAVVRIGLVGLRNMALAVSMSDITGGMKKDEWRHSITVAFVGDMLSRKAASAREVHKFSFVTGLMHDIGKLFLTRRYMLEYQTVYTKMNKGATQIEAERTTFGCDHAMVGGLLLQVWNVPVLIVNGIKQHHEPGTNKLAGVIYASNQLIEWSQLSPEKKTEIEIFGLQRDELEWIYSDATSKARDMESKIH
jgi:HD-like signal output (HDOD) protein